MMCKPIYYYSGNESDGGQEENISAPVSGWSGVLGDVDDFIFYYSGGYDAGDSGEYRSTR